MKKLFVICTLIIALLCVSCKTTETHYTITYHADPEQGLTIEREYSKNQVITNIDVPMTKDNYVLDGWCLDKALTEDVSLPYTVVKDIDFYAKWTRLYQVTFKNGNEIVETKSIRENEKVSKATAPANPGYSFTGWSSDEDTYTEFDFSTSITENKTLYAFYTKTNTPTPDTIVVTFKDGDDTLHSSTINKNSTVEEYTAPTKTGYTFTGWSSDKETYKEFDFSTTLDTDTSLYAFYEITKITVTYMLGTEVYTTADIDYDTNPTAPQTPNVLGSSFLYWCTDEACTKEFDFSTKLQTGTTLYAKLDPVSTHTLTLIVDGKTTQVLINQNATISTITPPSKEGHDLVGWYLDAAYQNAFDAATPITSNQTLYAYYKIQTFTVTFMNGNETVASKKVNYNETVSLPNALTKEGYTWNGWSTSNTSYVEFNSTTKITSDTTLYASFTMNTYTVTFMNGTETVASKKVNYSETVSLPNALTKEGYTWNGWSTSNTSYVEFNSTTKITSDTTLYASFTMNTYTVTFMNGTETVASKKVNYNETVSLPNAPNKNGYTWNGWSTSDTSYVEFNSTTKITSDTTLYASFTINTYKVTFMDGTTKIDEKTVEYNETVALPTAPTKTGYVFKGWSTSNTSLENFDVNTKITSSRTIYAYYVQEFTVTFNVDGTKTTTKVEKGSCVTEPENPTKDGYSFVCWLWNGAEFDFSTPITDSIELVADFSGRQENQIEIPNYSGYNEGLYFEANPVAGASISDYTVRYKLVSDSSWKSVDQQLIREQNNKIRCDIIGLPAGSYQVRVDASGKTRTIACEVAADDRSGYAHFNNTTGVGAYNDDGTLKSNAVVVYVTDSTKNTVKATIGGKEYTGLVKIIQACTSSSYALDIRVLGEIQTTQWNFKEHGAGNTSERQANLDETFNFASTKDLWDSTSSGNYYKLNQAEIISLGINSMSDDLAKGITQLNGLTNQVLRDKEKSGDAAGKIYEYDSYYNMLDVAGAYNITIEGIGTDAAIFQWGFAFKRCNSIEVKNLRFYNYTEDAVGFEGGSSSDNNYGNYWIHNCTFDIGVNNWDVCYENDKTDGDGSSDVKYCHNVTISYVQYNKTHKTNLIGSGDSALQYNITLHHNYYNNCGSRLPLVRQTNIHMYNNYYYKSSGYSNSIRANCYAFVENCYYEAGQNPYEVVTTSTYTGTAMKAYNNVYDNVKINGSSYKTGNNVTSRTASVSNTCKPDGKTDYSDFDTNTDLFYYDYAKQVSKVTSLLNPNDVPEHCKTYSGVLKANAKGLPTPTPEEPDLWQNQLNETFNSSATTITEISYNTTPPTTPGIYYSYDGGSSGSSTKNNVSIKDKALLIYDDSDATTYGYYIFDQTYTTGKVKISIDFNPNGNTNSKWAMLHFLDGSSNLRICTDGSKILGYSLDGGTTIIPVSGVITDTIYTIVLTIDYSEQKATVQIGADSVTFTYSNTIKGIMFQTAGSNSRTFSVDNLRIDTAE